MGFPYPLSLRTDRESPELACGSTFMRLAHSTRRESLNLEGSVLLTTMIRPSRVSKAETAVQPDGSWKKLGSEKGQGAKSVYYSPGWCDQDLLTGPEVFVGLQVKRLQSLLIIAVLCGFRNDRFRTPFRQRIKASSRSAHYTSREQPIAREW